ncbi:hypothetical protein Ciccas_002059 [Cichlidogyrus casuarinus]|uniref:Uncharacterized protein n=1 Tax=Cichlidogyrus casuarinus TaxID=1844966 RepID=A0ABD2QKJ5_9PLAT
MLDLISTAATINTSDAASTLLDDEEDASSIASTQYSSVPAFANNDQASQAAMNVNHIGSSQRALYTRNGTRSGASLLTTSSTNPQVRKPGIKKGKQNATKHAGTGMSLTSTSSELGIPDTVSLGSMTASPSCCCGEAMSGDASSM